MNPIQKSIEIPQGFLFAASAGGLRTHGSGPDVALAYSTVPARVAALFTTNRVKAAPVQLSLDHLKRSGGVAQAIVANAGNANCATGPAGMRAARQSAQEAAKLLGLRREQVLAASTGVIGVPLDARRIMDQLPALARRLHPEGYEAFSRAILTTDTCQKVAGQSLTVTGRRVHILGMAKGSGMIYPRMATMLVFIFTDAAVEPRFLQSAARRMCEESFNRISVDGDTSTNDTVFLMANGAAGNVAISKRSDAGEKFAQALVEVGQALAVELVRDGEGVGKLAEIRVEKAASEKQADAVARSIALSSLVKTALAGGDPNWGRILSAVGNAGVEFDPNRVNIYLNRTLVCRRGGAAAFDEASLQRELQGKNVLIRVVLGQGKATARFWTCDFTEEYVRINASYRT
ncbi:MAG: bifunctional glutamate N-acetyltransferase/amino-acid acetyltransferase ArgJ [Terriglobia bacterium]